MLQSKIVEQIKTHIFVQFFFQKSCLFLDNVEKYCRAGQVTNEGHAHGMLDKQTLRICNTHCFSTKTKQYCRAGQVTNEGHAHGMLDTQTLTIYNTHFLSTTTMVARMRLTVVFFR
jgi:cytoskeletal protein CcmA (bactofilin family)